MIPGFKLEDEFAVKKLDFDIIRLEKIGPNEIEGTLIQYDIPKECIDDIIEVMNSYYERKEKIDNANPGASYFSLAVYKDDALVVAKKLAEVLNIRISPMSPLADFETRTYTYEELIQNFIEEDYDLDVSWNQLSTIERDPNEDIERKMPNGIDSASFEISDYQHFVSEYVHPAVQKSDWRGANAWLCNLGIRELRNGRYKSAAYAFEGTRQGLTKHSFWDNSRISKIVDTSLVSLRELCLYHIGEGKLPNERMECDLENRDLVFIPEFIQKPEYPRTVFRFADQIWIANALILVQAVAHSMELPTISKTEVDPYGENLTMRNGTFVLRLAKKLYEDYLEKKAMDYTTPASSGFRTFQDFDLTKFSPEIALTRILESKGYNIRVYAGELELEDGIGIDYDFRADKDETDYLIRALRQEDKSKEKISTLNRRLSNKSIELLLLFDSEVKKGIVDEFKNSSSVHLYYTNLASEKIRPVSSGYPDSYGNLDTKKSIERRIKEKYEEARDIDDKNDKGDALEKLMKLIFEKAIPDTEVVDTNIRTRVEEIDLQLNNKRKRFPWNKLGADILVECKNWTKPAGVDVIYTVFGKAQMISPDCKGVILVCWEGISDGNRNRNGDQLIREIRQKGVNIVVLDKDDLEEISETGNAQKIIKKKANELGMR